MGVASLTTFVYKNNLGTVTTLPSSTDHTPIPAIVDGMAFTYFVGLVDTFEGGGYLRIRRNVRRYIEYWRQCGLEPEFVWDGPFDREKLPTVVRRSAQSLQRSLTYMRLPDHMRGQYKYSSAAARLPPLTHLCISAELELLGVPSHCAEGEADSPTAELAQRRNGYIISNDSDYFIYPAQCRGYIPLKSIQYGPYNQPRLEQVNPEHPASIQFRVFQPASIARAFSLPPPFLPVLAALVGNDLANYSEALHVPRRQASAGHVDSSELFRIAGALSTCSHMPVDTLAQVQDVVFAVLPQLLQGRTATDLQIVTNLASAAFSYTLQPLEAGSPSFPLRPRPTTDTPSQALARAAYNRAYQDSHFPSFIPHVLKHGAVLCQGSVEQPEFQSPMIRVVRPLRRWVYAVVRDAVGLLSDSVTEYVRRDNELHAAVVEVVPLGTLLAARGIDPLSWAGHSPIVLAPLALRQRFFLVALGYPATVGDGSSVGAEAEVRWPAPDTPSARLLPLTLALRHLLPLLPEAQSWSLHQVRCALVVGSVLLHAPDSLSPIVSAAHSSRRCNNRRGGNGGSGAGGGGSAPTPPPRKDLIQHSVELVQTLVGINMFARSLLLDHPPDPGATVLDGVPSPHEVFDGAALHALWQLSEHEVDQQVSGTVPDDVRATVDTLEQIVWSGLALPFEQ